MEMKNQLKEVNSYLTLKNCILKNQNIVFYKYLSPRLDVNFELLAQFFNNTSDSIALNLKLIFDKTVYGFSRPQNLRSPLSSYQDSYGFVGGKVILKNLCKMKALKRQQKVKLKLKENLES